MSYRKPKIKNQQQKNKNIEYTHETKVIADNKEKEMKENNEIVEYNEDNIDDVIKAFEYFDMAHSGKIKVSDLTKALSTFGNIMTEEEMFNIFREAGIRIDTEEEIDYIKFINFWIGEN